MKRIFILTITILSTISLFAKNKNVVTGLYDRSSYSVIVLDRYKQYSSGCIKWANSYNPLNHLDYNDIKTKIIPYDTYRNSLKSIIYDYPDKSKVCAWLTEAKIGQEIVFALFNRQADGQMDDSIVRSRGLYNARFVDEQIAEGTMLGKEVILQDKGYDLIDKCYVMVLCIGEIELKSYEDGQMLKAGLGADLYKLDLNEDLLNDVIFGSTMVLPSDSEAVKNKKLKEFNDLDFKFEKVASFGTGETKSVGVFSGSKEIDYIPKLYNKLYKELLVKMDKKLKLEDFNIQTPVESKNPIKAKIGEKESLKNNQRYDAYKYIMKPNGSIEAKRSGIVRVTTIAENKEDNTQESEFIQVAGHDIRPGYILRKKRDAEITLSPYYRIGALEGYGFNWEATGGKMRSNGRSNQGGIYFNYTSYDITELNDGKHSYITERPLIYGEDWGAFSIGLRWGWMQRFLRFFEAGITLNLGTDTINAKFDDESSEIIEYKELGYAKASSGTAFAGTVGGILRVNIAYPLHFIVGIDYTVAAGGENYKFLNNVLKDVDSRRDGLGYMIGLSMSF